METFVRIAQAGSLSGAAEQLGTSRSLVTKQLQAVEDHLGIALFERTTRRLSLTEAGREYLIFCKRILAEIDLEERNLADSQAKLSGRIRILAPIAFGNLYLAPVVADFLSAHPGVVITLILSDASMSRAEMVESGFDVAIHLSQVRDQDAIVRRIGKVKWVVCASKEFISANGCPKRPEDLVRFNCLVHRKVTPDGAWKFRQPDGDKEVKVVGSLLTNSVFPIRSAALAGQGIAMLPTYCIEADLSAGHLVQILCDTPVPCRPVYAVYAQSQFLPERVREFVSFLARRLQSLVFNESEENQGGEPKD